VLALRSPAFQTEIQCWASRCSAPLSGYRNKWITVANSRLRQRVIRFAHQLVGPGPTYNWQQCLFTTDSKDLLCKIGSIRMTCPWRPELYLDQAEMAGKSEDKQCRT